MFILIILKERESHCNPEKILLVEQSPEKTADILRRLRRLFSQDRNPVPKIRPESMAWNPKFKTVLVCRIFVFGRWGRWVL